MFTNLTEKPFGFMSNLASSNLELKQKFLFCLNDLVQPQPLNGGDEVDASNDVPSKLIFPPLKCHCFKTVF